MKLLHTADWHLGMPLGSESYENDQRYFLDRLYELVEAHQVQAVLCAGDIYDSSVTTARAVGLFDEAATRLCRDLGVQLLVIAGNHDSGARLSTCAALLKNAGMYVFGKLKWPVEPVLLDGGRVAVYCLPYYTRDEVAALFPHEETGSQEQASEVLCSHIRQGMDPARKNIVMAHGFLVDAELSDSDRSAKVGFASAVSREVFRGFDYVALGHIHKPQVLSGSIRYSGSPLKYSFGEEKQEKGVVLLDTDTMTQEFIPVPPLHDRRTLEGAYEELTALTGLESCYLKLRLTDRYAGPELYQDLKEKFPNLLELTGKSISNGEEGSTLSLEALKTLDETEVLTRFLAETYGCSPSEEELTRFRRALEESEKEEMLG